MSHEHEDGYTEEHTAYLRQRADFEKYLEMRGEHDVRACLLTGTFYPAEKRSEAARWLGVKDQASLARSAASISEQIEAARSANRIATQARNAARAALVVAAISTIVGIVALLIH
jgi:hypothetical protein